MTNEEILKNFTTQKLLDCVEAYESDNFSLDLTNLHYILNTSHLYETIDVIIKEIQIREEKADSQNKIWHDEL